MCTEPLKSLTRNPMAKSVANEEQTELERAVSQNHENISTLLSQALGVPVDLSPARADVLEGGIVEALSHLKNHDLESATARLWAMKTLEAAVSRARKL